MTSIALWLIAVYQKIISPLLHQLLGVQGNVCRFTPTCSEYAKQVIKKYGMIHGGKLAIQRLLRCQPFAKAI